MNSTSVISIKKESLRTNVKYVKSIIGDQTILSVVVKGNAYGHGVSVVVSALESFGVNHFSVYSSPEAKEVLKVKRKNSTVMIMGFIYKEDFEWIIENKIEFFVSDISTLNHAIETAEALNKKAIIHIDLETGMNRTGLNLKQLKKAIDIINKSKKYLTIQGVTSHFAGAESIANHTRVKKQFFLFKKRIKFLNENGIFPKIRHIASSAATIVYPETQLDLVRVGILVYGYWPSKETFIYYINRKKDKTDPLKRAIHWCSEVASVKEVNIGEFVGYGLSYQTQQKTKIMIVPVGYCNGFSRSLSNNGHVIVHGQISPVIGSVNMNMTICDITHIPDVKCGDRVIMIGNQGDKEISFASFAEMNQSLNYEILARLPLNIDRELV